MTLSLEGGGVSQKMTSHDVMTRGGLDTPKK